MKLLGAVLTGMAIGLLPVSLAHAQAATAQITRPGDATEELAAEDDSGDGATDTAADSGEPDGTTPHDAMDFAMHDAQFTIYHEIGHLLVGEFGLPVLGKEEDAADALAVILILNDTTDPTESENALIDTADGWYFNAVKTTGHSVEDFSYYDEHSLDIQRAYAMVCMMVGGKPAEFKETADIYELDQDRQEACGGTFSQAANAWDTLLQPHFADATPGAKISVVYEDAADGSKPFEDELKSRKILDNAAELVSTKFKLPRPLKFVATQCDVANAWYDPSDGTITYCYTLTNDMYNLYVSDIIPSIKDDAGSDDEDASAVEDGSENADEAPDDAAPDGTKPTSGGRGG